MGEARRRGTRDDRRRAPKGDAWRAVRGEPVVYDEEFEATLAAAKLLAAAFAVGRRVPR